MTPDGRRATSISEDGVLKVWDLESGVELRSLIDHGTSIITVAMTPDGRRGISKSENWTLKVWDLKKRAELYTLSRPYRFDHGGYHDTGWTTGSLPGQGIKL